MLTALFVLLVLPVPAFAGMPVVTLSFVAGMGLESLSLLLFSCVLFTLIVHVAWKGLSAAFPDLPRSTVCRAGLLVAAWILFVMMTLLLISGTREALTPGAWTPSGLTYKLALTPERTAWTDAQRRRKIETLRRELWSYADRHGRQLPPHELSGDIPTEAWRSVDLDGQFFVYIPGRKVGEGHAVVCYEPGTFGGQRYALFSDGKVELCDVRTLTSGASGGPGSTPGVSGEPPAGPDKPAR